MPNRNGIEYEPQRDSETGRFTKMVYPEPELGRCPWCGEQLNTESGTGGWVAGLWWVQCDACGARGPEEPTREKAALYWIAIMGVRK